MSAGIYLKVIRDRRHLSRADLARSLGVSTQTIANIENGDKEPGSALLFAYIARVHASLHDVSVLMLGRDDENEAYRRADEYLREGDQLERVHRLFTDPDLRDAWIRVADSLRE